MDTSAYLLELAQKFHLTSFDGDLSTLNSSDGSMTSVSSPDQSTEDAAALMDASAMGDISATRSPPVRASSSSSSSAAAEQKSKERSERNEDLRIKYDQLKKNHRTQTTELDRITKQLDELKHTASRERSDLEEKYRQADHARSLVESQLHKIQLEFNHTLSVKQSELASLTHTLRTTQAQLSDANPDVLKQIEYVKDDLSDLFISEAMYLEYKNIDRHRQTIREYVCCSVYELVRAEKSAKEAMGRELEMIRERLIKSEDEADRNGRERDQLAKLKRSRETELLAELQHYETLNAKLHEDVTKKTMAVNELTTKGELYDALRLKAERLEEDYHSLQQKDLLNTLSVRTLTDEKEANASKLFNLEKSQDLLRQDKMYLTKEVERLTECYRNSEKDKDRTETKLVELKRQKEDLVDKLVRVREEHQQSYEEKLNAELNRLQSRTSADLDSIRVNQREAYEREISGLKEARDNISKEQEKLKTALEGLKEDYSTLQEEHRRLQSQLESERTDTRNALKLKSFEYERLALTYEETMADLRKLKLEHEVLGKKQQVLKTEFYTLQGETQKRILSLEQTERSLTEKLSMYQQLEYELDMAILNAGGVDEVQDKAALHGGQIRGIHHMLESLGTNIPTANKRRIKQSILLAQQLVEKQKMIEVLTKECNQVKDKLSLTETELASAQQSLSFVAQPHNYLIANLQVKDQELLKEKERAQQLARQLEQSQADLQRTLSVKSQLESDLHRLLSGKNQVEQLKEALLKGQRGAIHMPQDQQEMVQQFKENVRPSQQQHSMGEEKHFSSSNDPKHHWTTKSLAHSQGPPAHLTHHQLPVSQLASSQGRQPQTDDHPRPMWFKQLTR